VERQKTAKRGVLANDENKGFVEFRLQKTKNASAESWRYKILWRTIT
jgi:hypothetical protein